MAGASARNGTPLPDQFWRHARLWETLGYPAFLAMLGVYFLMVLKPAFG